MNIAVTGASGHIGNVVCRQLLEAGHQVSAFYNSDVQALQGLAVRLVKGSVLNLPDLERLIEGSEVVINCAAIISIDGDPNGLIFKTNTEGPKNIFQVSISKGVKRLIHISSVHAVTELPHSQPYDETRPYKTSSDYVYDYSKAFSEQWLLSESSKHAIDLVILRPSCCIGPYDFKPSKMGGALLDFYHQKVPILPDGGYDLVDVRDVAASIVSAIDRGRSGEIYLLSGKYYDFSQLSAVIHQVTGKSVPKLVMPYHFLKAMLPFARLFFKLTKATPTLTIESIDAVKHGHPNMDNSKAIGELAHRNRPLSETLRDFYQWQKIDILDARR